MPSVSPHALRPSAFQAPGWGAPALLSSRCGRSTTSWRLAPFSHRSASRIFIRQPGCIPSPMVTQDSDHQFDGGEKQAGLRPLPSASRIFIILAGAEGELSRSSTSRMGRQATSSFSIQGRGRSRPSGGGGLRQHGADWPQASSAPACLVRWLWHSFRCHLPPLGGVWLSARRTGGCCAARTGGPSKTSRAARAAFVFLGCPAFAPA
jgi:hypothetical protein